MISRQIISNRMGISKAKSLHYRSATQFASLARSVTKWVTGSGLVSIRKLTKILSSDAVNDKLSRCGGMADAMDSKSIDRKIVEVQVLSPVFFHLHAIATTCPLSQISVFAVSEALIDRMWKAGEIDFVIVVCGWNGRSRSPRGIRCPPGKRGNG
jgi:hypothetical protein